MTSESTQPLDAVGIDISKDSMHLAVLPKGQSKAIVKKFANSASGIAEGLHWVQHLGIAPETAHFCMEATGVYYELVADTLHEAGFMVSVVNPAVINKFMQMRQHRSKTDAADARGIRQYAETCRPQPYKPVAQHLRRLQELVRYRQALVEERTRELNRLHALRPDSAIAGHIQQSIAACGDRISAVEADIEAFINSHDDLKRDRDLLCSIDGIAHITAHALLAELPYLHHYRSAKQLAAHAGVTPRHRQSGSSLNAATPISKIGNRAIMRILFHAAQSALRWNPIIHHLNQRLKDKNKAYKQRVCAAMRNLLHLVFGVIKHQRPFDREFLHKKLQPQQDSLTLLA